MAEFPTYEQMAKEVAEKALDGYLIDGKTLREWIKIIEERKPKTATCEDCISRQAVLDQARDYGSGTFLIPVNTVKTLPSINPQETKTGHWIRYNNGKYHWYLCSCCDAMAGSDEKMMTYKYCPNCGAKMKVEE